MITSLTILQFFNANLVTEYTGKSNLNQTKTNFKNAWTLLMDFAWAAVNFSLIDILTIALVRALFNQLIPS